MKMGTHIPMERMSLAVTYLLLFHTVDEREKKLQDANLIIIN